MPDTSPVSQAVLEAFQSALWSCRQIYLTAAQESVQFHPEATRGSGGDFVQSMIELSRGLALKIFVTIAQADWHWSTTERALAEELFEFVWAERLSGSDLKEALLHVVEHAHELSWGNLVRPFETLPPFASRSQDLIVAALRLANVVAKADGGTNEDELRLLDHIRSELERLLVPIPLDWSVAPQATGKSVSQAAQITQRVSQQVRPQQAVAAGPPLHAKIAPLQQPSREVQLADALAELDQLIGITTIKQDVRELINFLKMQAERVRLGLPTTPVSLHMVFRGNPGTGKTTVARIIGRVLGGMGILEKGHLVECDRSGLVAEYAGQTGPKTNRVIDAALDGVLFIDEAYSLVSERGDDAYGAEAVQTLLKRMEDDRKRLVVILAGYNEPLDRLLQSNPGLSSRFSRSFTFPNYTTIELCRIFAAVCQANQYQLTPATRARLLCGCQKMLADSDESFGNARTMRNIFEQAIRRLANRIAQVTPVTKALLCTLEAEDVVLDGQAWSDKLSDALRFRVECPACHHSSRPTYQFLGRRVRCKHCGHEFSADWGEPIDE